MKDRKMPPVTLRTYQVERNHYDGKGLHSEDRPIYFNKPRMDLLAATKAYGMTPAIINTWTAVQTDDAGYLCDSQGRGDYRAVGEYLWHERRGKYVEFKKVTDSMRAYVHTYGITRDTLFTKKHQDAAIDLICKKGMKPLHAMTTISNVSGDEALLIARFMDVGMTNAVLVANRDHQIYRAAKYESIGDTYYATALEFLIRKQKVSLKDAMHELQDLCPSQMKILVDLYADGLRGDDIRQAGGVDACKRYADMTVKQDDWAVTTVTYFKKLYHHAVLNGKREAEALADCLSQIPDDIRYVNNNDISIKKFALKHFDRGVRASDLSPEFAQPEAKMAIASLRFLAKLSVADAVAELRGLDADKMAFLSKHYRHGVRNKHLVGLNHSSKDVVFLMKTYEFTSVKAIEVARTITPFQMGYLQAFAKHGLTIDEAKSLELNSAITSDREDVALFLVNEKSYGLVNALRHVSDKSGEELVRLMKEDVFKLHSIRL